ncbi:hypothetical protein MSG28_009133 [Choristoneura fumiferana]|uniref:Uncharacterized protein n=1 Tax=Choristoneura fumiferana TaxID=7141 RepID=A0ACC0KXL6_CHOFU|nr:hypothetical protein MSG28_009133 [Choristoneura fumiferana]
MGREKSKKRKKKKVLKTEGPPPRTPIMKTMQISTGRTSSRNVIQVRRFMRRVRADGGEVAYIPTQTVAVTFASTQLPEYVYLDSWRHEVTQYVPPVKQCLKCQQFGHIAKFCKNNEVCSICSENHNYKACGADKQNPVCANCKVTFCVPLHRFPHPTRKPDLFNAWMSVVGDKLQETDQIKIYKSKRLCDHHFDPNDKISIDRIKPSAIPSVNLHLPPVRHTMFFITFASKNFISKRKNIILPNTGDTLGCALGSAALPSPSRSLRRSVRVHVGLQQRAQQHQYGQGLIYRAWAS